MTDDLLANFDSSCQHSALELFTQFVNETETLAYYQQISAHRNDAIVSAHDSGGYTMTQIASHFKVHY